MRPFEVRRRIGDEGGGRKIMTTLLWEPTNLSVHGPTKRSVAELTYHHDQMIKCPITCHEMTYFVSIFRHPNFSDSRTQVNFKEGLNLKIEPLALHIIRVIKSSI